MEEKSLEEKAASAQVRKLFFLLTASAGGGGYMILCKPQVRDTVHMGALCFFLAAALGRSQAGSEGSSLRGAEVHCGWVARGLSRPPVQSAAG